MLFVQEGQLCSAPQNHSEALGGRESTSCSCLSLQQEKKQLEESGTHPEGTPLTSAGVSLGRISHMALPDFKRPEQEVYAERRKNG